LLTGKEEVNIKEEKRRKEQEEQEGGV